MFFFFGLFVYLSCEILGRVVCLFCFFKQKTAYEVRISDWSSDVCSSDLDIGGGQRVTHQCVDGVAVERDPGRGIDGATRIEFASALESLDRAPGIGTERAVDFTRREVRTIEKDLRTPHRGAFRAVVGTHRAADGGIVDAGSVQAGTFVGSYRRSEEHPYELQPLMRISDTLSSVTKTNTSD